VVERQPAPEQIARRRARRVHHRPDVREQVGVRQHDALRIARAARCVLDERDVVGARCDPAGVAASSGERRRRRHPAHGRGVGLQQSCDRHRLRHRHEDGGLRVGEDTRVPAHVVLDLREACRRVDRHRDAAGEQHAVVDVEVVR